MGRYDLDPIPDFTYGTEVSKYQVNITTSNHNTGNGADKEATGEAILHTAPMIHILH